MAAIEDPRQEVADDVARKMVLLGGAGRSGGAPVSRRGTVVDGFRCHSPTCENCRTFMQESTTTIAIGGSLHLNRLGVLGGKGIPGETLAGSFTPGMANGPGKWKFAKEFAEEIVNGILTNKAIWQRRIVCFAANRFGDYALKDYKSKNVIHRRKWLTLEEKLKIIVANENGKTSTRIAREEGMNESSVRSILRKKEFYKSLGTSTSFHRFKSFARHRSLLLDKVEKRLVGWIEENNRKRVQMTETEIQRKALALFNELKPAGNCTEKFSASRGWFYRFKNRINLQNCIISGEKPPMDREAADRFRSDFVKIVEDGGYTHHQIFNVEETSLCWKAIPSQVLLPERDKGHKGHRPSKDSLTLLLGSNASGDLKLKPMIVYRSETPSALKDCEKDSLPVIWRSNKKAWLTRELFEEWFTDHFCPTVKNYCHDLGLEFKILLLLDSTPSHEVSRLHEGIRVALLPPFTASLLQPMTLGVFPVLKTSYLRQIFSQALSSSASDASLQEFWSGYNIKDGMDNIIKCWHDSSPEDLAASWHRLLPDVKVKDFESQTAAIARDVVSLGQYLGLKAFDVQKVQHCMNSTPFYSEPPAPDFEEVICKEEPPEAYEDEAKARDPEPSTEELERIVQSVDAACDLIAAVDLNIERSLKVRQVLQNGIQPYRRLYVDRTKEKFKCANKHF